MHALAIHRLLGCVQGRGAGLLLPNPVATRPGGQFFRPRRFSRQANRQTLYMERCLTFIVSVGQASTAFPSMSVALQATPRKRGAAFSRALTWGSDGPTRVAPAFLPQPQAGRPGSTHVAPQLYWLCNEKKKHAKGLTRWQHSQAHPTRQACRWRKEGPPKPVGL